MGHSITVVPRPVAGVSSTIAATPEEIAELEQLWSGLFSLPEGATNMAHYISDTATKAAVGQYKNRANSYLRNRPEGALNLREVRRQNMPDGQMKFVIEPYTKGQTA
jgi:hypothetical protein